jgi:hypothetical protein
MVDAGIPRLRPEARRVGMKSVWFPITDVSTPRHPADRIGSNSCGRSPGTSRRARPSWCTAWAAADARGQSLRACSPPAASSRRGQSRWFSRRAAALEALGCELGYRVGDRLGASRGPDARLSRRPRRSRRRQRHGERLTEAYPGGTHPLRVRMAVGRLTPPVPGVLIDVPAVQRARAGHPPRLAAGQKPPATPTCGSARAETIGAGGTHEIPRILAVVAHCQTARSPDSRRKVGRTSASVSRTTVPSILASMPFRFLLPPPGRVPRERLAAAAGHLLTGRRVLGRGPSTVGPARLERAGHRLLRGRGRLHPDPPRQDGRSASIMLLALRVAEVALLRPRLRLDLRPDELGDRHHLVHFPGGLHAPRRPGRARPRAGSRSAPRAIAPSHRPPPDSDPRRGPPAPGLAVPVPPGERPGRAGGPPPKGCPGCGCARHRRPPGRPRPRRHRGAAPRRPDGRRARGRARTSTGGRPARGQRR